MNNEYMRYESSNGISFYHSSSDNKQSGTVKSQEKRFYCEILFLISGCLVFELDNTEYQISHGEILLLNANSFQTLKVKSTEPYESITFRFLPNLVPKLSNIDLLESFTIARSFRHIIPSKTVEHSNVKQLLFSIQDCCKENKAYTDLQIVALLLDLLKELDELTRLSKTKNSNTQFSIASVNSFPKLCIEYINNNLSQKLTTKKIADYLYLSQSYLHDCFFNELGISIHQYILNQKMQLASLMLNSGQPPHQVAKELGYEYYSTFLKNFHSFFGYNPTQYNASTRKKT